MTQGSCLGAFVAILALASTANGATLTVTGGGLLAGATGVNVGGTLYDVEFVDGSPSLMAAMRSPDFEFTTELLQPAVGGGGRYAETSRGFTLRDIQEDLI
jgi:hypothetical protein